MRLFLIAKRIFWVVLIILFGWLAPSHAATTWQSGVSYFWRASGFADLATISGASMNPGCIAEVFETGGTVYVVYAAFSGTTAGELWPDKIIPDDLKAGGSGSGVSYWVLADHYMAGVSVYRVDATSINVSGVPVAVSGGAYHDGFSDFVGNEHVAEDIIHSKVSAWGVSGATDWSGVIHPGGSGGGSGVSWQGADNGTVASGETTWYIGAGGMRTSVQSGVTVTFFPAGTTIYGSDGSSVSGASNIWVVIDQSGTSSTVVSDGIGGATLYVGSRPDWAGGVGLGSIGTFFIDNRGNLWIQNESGVTILEYDQDQSSFSGVSLINPHIENEIHHLFDATNMAADETRTGIDAIIETDGDEGNVHYIDVARGGHGNAKLTALGTHSSVAVIRQLTGTFNTAVSAFKVMASGNTFDVTTEFASGTTDVFENDNDKILIGYTSPIQDARWEIIPGSKDADVTFRYSSGSSGWALILANDDTEGFKENGLWRLDIPATSTQQVIWDTGGSSGTSSPYLYWVEGQRTWNNMTTAPQVSGVSVLGSTEASICEWDEVGGVTIVNLNISGNVDLSGASPSVNTPTDNSHAVNKAYVDGQIAGASGSPGGDTNTFQMNLAGVFGGTSIYQDSGGSIWMVNNAGITTFVQPAAGGVSAYFSTLDHKVFRLSPGGDWIFYDTSGKVMMRNIGGGASIYVVEFDSDGGVIDSADIVDNTIAEEDIDWSSGITLSGVSLVVINMDILFPVACYNSGITMPIPYEVDAVKYPNGIILDSVQMKQSGATAYHVTLIELSTMMSGTSNVIEPLTASGGVIEVTGTNINDRIIDAGDMIGIELTTSPATNEVHIKIRGRIR